jgi:hypothetical protein
MAEGSTLKTSLCQKQKSHLPARKCLLEYIPDQSKCQQQLKNSKLYPTTGAQKRPSTYATKILHINV